MAKDAYGNPSQPVTGTDVDTDYGGAVVDRVVPIYPSNAARDAVITSPTEGQIAYITDDNALKIYNGSAWKRVADPVQSDPETDASTGSGVDTLTSFTLLSEWGALSSEVQVTVTTRTAAIVLIKCQLSNSTAGALTYLSYSVSGATTIAATDRSGLWYESGAASDRLFASGHHLNEALNAGSNTFTLMARVSAGTGTIESPVITVIPL